MLLLSFWHGTRGLDDNLWNHLVYFFFNLKKIHLNISFKVQYFSFQDEVKCTENSTPTVSDLSPSVTLWTIFVRHLTSLTNNYIYMWHSSAFSCKPHIYRKTISRGRGRYRMINSSPSPPPPLSLTISPYFLYSLSALTL